MFLVYLNKKGIKILICLVKLNRNRKTVTKVYRMYLKPVLVYIVRKYFYPGTTL